MTDAREEERLSQDASEKKIIVYKEEMSLMTIFVIATAWKASKFYFPPLPCEQSHQNIKSNLNIIRRLLKKMTKWEQVVEQRNNHEQAPITFSLLFVLRRQPASISTHLV